MLHKLKKSFFEVEDEKHKISYYLFNVKETK
jgi:hypothetical protein